MIDELRSRFRRVAPAEADFVSLRFQEERSEAISVRQGVLEPVGTTVDGGVMITVIAGGGLGYAATAHRHPGKRGLQMHRLPHGPGLDVVGLQRKAHGFRAGTEAVGSQAHNSQPPIRQTIRVFRRVKLINIDYHFGLITFIVRS